MGASTTTLLDVFQSRTFMACLQILVPRLEEYKAFGRNINYRLEVTCETELGKDVARIKAKDPERESVHRKRLGGLACKPSASRL